jgi:hypothetical protein
MVSCMVFLLFNAAYRDPAMRRDQCPKPRSA